MKRPAMQWFVRSTDGTNYRVGQWFDGQWFPGDRARAEREHALLGEPGSWIWASSSTPEGRI